MKIQPTNSDFTGNEPVSTVLKICGAQGLYQSLCIMGDFATGKDKVARDIYELKLKQNKIVEKLSWRRNTADAIDAKTIEDFFELPSSVTHTTDVYTAGISNAKKELLRKIDTVIIYEVSTMPGQMLDIIDYILRIIRKGVHQYSHQVPFGGVQFIFIGDHFVYSPFTLEDAKGERTCRKYFFESDSFKNSEPIFINLTENCGDLDAGLWEMMKKIRVKENAHELVREIKAIVADNKKCDPPYKMRIVRTNDKEAAVNEAVFKNEVVATASSYRKPHKNHSVFKQRFLCISVGKRKEDSEKDYKGGMVRFFCDDPEGRFHIGDLGYDLCINGRQSALKLESGESIEVEPTDYRVNKWDLTQKRTKHTIEFEYRFPFDFTFASTIHRTHNMRFQFIEFQLGGKRFPGHMHIALTRCESLKSLMLYNALSVYDILVPDVVYEFDEMIKSEQQAVRLQELLAVLGDYQ